MQEGFGRFGESEKLKRRALAIDEKSFGLAHPKVAKDLNNLAVLLQDTNRVAEAEPLMRRALAIDEKTRPIAISRSPEPVDRIFGLTSLEFG